MKLFGRLLVYPQISAYGFLQDVKTLDGRPHPDVFLRAKTLTEESSFGKRQPLKQLDGAALVFETRPSAMHQGKEEACKVRDASVPAPV